MKITLLMILSIFISCSSMKSQKMNITHYKKVANKLISENNNGSDSKNLQTLSDELIALAKPIIEGHKENHPECNDFLNFVLNKSIEMKSITLAQIESDYHSGEALPQSDDVCLEAKELIVHPATVYIITKNKRLNTDQRSQINDEIVEVINHIDMLE